jgi:thiamine-phosphate pyrophosphorylase
MDTPKNRFYNNPGRVYCFADTVDLGRQLLSAGARVIQLRNKTADDIRFRQTAVEMMRLIRGYPDALLIVNDRVHIALQVGADGIHVGQQDTDYRQVIRRVPAEMIVGVSARYPELAAAAEKAGAAYIGAGSVAATSTKTDAPVIGLEGLQVVVAAVKFPVVAIGGITAANIGRIAAVGVRYCAVISAINNARDPAAALNQLEAIIAQQSA